MILLELVCPGLIEVAVKSRFHKRSSPLQLSLLEMVSSERYILQHEGDGAGGQEKDKHKQ